MFPFRVASVVPAALLAVALVPTTVPAGEEKIPLQISGGDSTDPRDGGRPVALVAGGLRVTPDVFRNAFSRVRPASGGREPEPAQVRQNKSVLLAALGPHGVTNDELDRVSNFYRYRPGGGRKWPTRAAAGYALLQDGKLKSIVITEPGYGYNSEPRVSIPGYPELTLETTLAFTNDLQKNGSVSAVTSRNEKALPPQSEIQLLPPHARRDLQLTDAQEREIAAIEKDAAERLAKILTPDQRRKLLAP